MPLLAIARGTRFFGAHLLGDEATRRSRASDPRRYRSEKERAPRAPRATASRVQDASARRVPLGLQELEELTRAP